MRNSLDRLSPYFLVGPAVLVIIVGCLYPTMMAVRLSFFRWSLGDPWSHAKWVGLSAFRQMLTDPAVLQSLGVTVAFAAIVVTAELVMGTALALLLERQIPGMSLFRTLFIMPMMVAPIVVGMIWRYMFDTQFGPANALLRALHIAPQSWLASPPLAFLAVVISDIWQWTPFIIIMVLAGLQNLDHSALEAAQIDGATPAQVILRIKLPMLMPVLIITALMRMIDAFRVLEVIFALTFGGPGSATEVLPLHIYKTAFVGQQLGYASAIAVLLLVVVFALSLATLALSNPLKDHHQ